MELPFHISNADFQNRLIPPTCHNNGKFPQHAHVEESEVALDPLSGPEHRVLLHTIFLRQSHVGLIEFRARNLVHFVMHVFARVHVKARVQK